MACVKLSKRKSNIDGDGLFADEFIKKGKIIMVWLYKAKLINEETYITEQENGNKNMIITGARGVGNIFLHTSDKPRYENYINHSENPNVLYHAGICYALCNIEKDTELTTNYTYLLSPKDKPVVDLVSGKKIIGVSAMLCLKQTSKMLHDLMENINDENDLEPNILSPFCESDILPDTHQHSPRQQLQVTEIKN